MTTKKQRCEICNKILNDVSIRSRDPYCSTLCARAAYGNPLPDNSIWSRNPKSTRSRVSENPGFVESERA